MFDPEGIVVLRNSERNLQSICATTLHNVEQEEGVHDLDGWDLLGDWKDVKEMEDFYGSSDSDPLAFVSLIVLS
jgi:hypothetical protein